MLNDELKGRGEVIFAARKQELQSARERRQISKKLLAIRSATAVVPPVAGTGAVPSSWGSIF